MLEEFRVKYNFELIRISDNLSGIKPSAALLKGNLIFVNDFDSAKVVAHALDFMGEKCILAAGENAIEEGFLSQKKNSITKIHNLIYGLIENHIYQGTDLAIENVYWHKIREDDASELSMIVSVSKNPAELKERIENLIVGKNNGSYIYAKDIINCKDIAEQLEGYILPLLAEDNGIPLILQGTMIGSGGDAISAALHANYAVCVYNALGFYPESIPRPDCIAIAVSLDTIKKNSLKSGFEELKRYLSVFERSGNPYVVALKSSDADSLEEIYELFGLCENAGIRIEQTQNAADLVRAIQREIEISEHKTASYDLSLSIKEKLDALERLYDMKIILSEEAQAQVPELDGFRHPVLLTQLRGTEIPAKIIISRFEIWNGAGIIIAH